MSIYRHNHTSRIRTSSAFWRFFVLYLIMLGMTLLAYIPIYSLTLNISRHSYLDEVNSYINLSGETLSNSIDAIYKIQTALQPAKSYSNMALLNTAPLPIDHYAHLSIVRDNFARQQAFSFSPDESFIYFLNSNSGTTTIRAFPEMTNCFESYIRYERYNAYVMMDKLVSLSKTELISDRISLNAKPFKQYLTVIIKPNNANVVFGSLMSEDKILSLYNIPTLPEHTFLYITDAYGDVIFSHGYDQLPIEMDSQFTETTRL